MTLDIAFRTRDAWIMSPHVPVKSSLSRKSLVTAFFGALKGPFQSVHPFDMMAQIDVAGCFKVALFAVEFIPRGQMHAPRVNSNHFR